MGGGTGLFLSQFTQGCWLLVSAVSSQINFITVIYLPCDPLENFIGETDSLSLQTSTSYFTGSRPVF